MPSRTAETLARKREALQLIGLSFWGVAPSSFLRLPGDAKLKTRLGPPRAVSTRSAVVLLVVHGALRPVLLATHVGVLRCSEVPLHTQSPCGRVLTGFHRGCVCFRGLALSTLPIGLWLQRRGKPEGDRVANLGNGGCRTFRLLNACLYNFNAVPLTSNEWSTGVERCRLVFVDKVDVAKDVPGRLTIRRAASGSAPKAVRRKPCVDIGPRRCSIPELIRRTGGHVSDATGNRQPRDCRGPSQ